MCVYVNIYQYIHIPYVCIYVSGYFLRVLWLQVVNAARAAVIALLQAQQQSVIVSRHSRIFQASTVPTCQRSGNA